MTGRYEVLEEIPETLKVIQGRLDAARGRPLGEVKRHELIIGAGEASLATLTKLRDHAPLWLALQRQVLLQTWWFGELDQLDQLNVPATERLLVALQVRPESCGKQLTEKEFAKEIVDDAAQHVRQVREAAKHAALRGGVHLPDASIKQRIFRWLAFRTNDQTDQTVDVMLVDDTHRRLSDLQSEIAKLLHWAHEGQLDDADHERLLERCSAGIIVTWSITVAALQIDEIKDAMVRVATDLAPQLEQVPRPLAAIIGMLALIMATKQVSDVIRGDLPGAGDGPRWSPGARPPQPEGEANAGPPPPAKRGPPTIPGSEAPGTQRSAPRWRSSGRGRRR
jgi:hypothetical protein